MLQLSGSGRGLEAAQNRLPAGDRWQLHSACLARVQDGRAPLAGADAPDCEPVVLGAPSAPMCPGAPSAPMCPQPRRRPRTGRVPWTAAEPAAGSAQDEWDLNLTSSALEKSHGVAGNEAQWPPAGFSVRPVMSGASLHRGQFGAFMVLNLHHTLLAFNHDTVHEIRPPSISPSESSACASQPRAIHEGFP